MQLQAPHLPTVAQSGSVVAGVWIVVVMARTVTDCTEVPVKLTSQQGWEHYYISGTTRLVMRSTKASKDDLGSSLGGFLE